MRCRSSAISSDVKDDAELDRSPDPENLSQQAGITGIARLQNVQAPRCARQQTGDRQSLAVAIETGPALAVAKL